MAHDNTKPFPRLSPGDKERFWENVQLGKGRNSCWLWTGGRSEKGYGLFYVSINGKRKKFRAHRLSLFLALGEDFGDLMVLHSCHTAACVNPEHLRPGTALENLHDWFRKMVAETGFHPGRGGASEEELRAMARRNESEGIETRTRGRWHGIMVNRILKAQEGQE